MAIDTPPGDRVPSAASRAPSSSRVHPRSPPLRQPLPSKSGREKAGSRPSHAEFARAAELSAGPLVVSLLPTWLLIQARIAPDPGSDSFLMSTSGSKLDGVLADTGRDVRADGAVADNVDASSEQRFDVLPERDEVNHNCAPPPS